MLYNGLLGLLKKNSAEAFRGFCGLIGGSDPPDDLVICKLVVTMSDICDYQLTMLFQTTRISTESFITYFFIKRILSR